MKCRLKILKIDVEMREVRGEHPWVMEARLC